MGKEVVAVVFIVEGSKNVINIAKIRYRFVDVAK